ncbi:glutathione S-transferase family protein [Bordetella sp. 15P40C-2]|uniref:glutathione S-transferase family protein n=1 Tax=Bordetella sp. 15P40C-2 TaxID=2572246 RepID=UPI0013206E96|nr:glutathione S-transferase [Bordetella sp. 15P40C-2]MVW70310.1 glutathione S-transferase [Bordetella sp. 15P40C-2]
MLKIWGRSSSVNVQKVLWTARELALPHTAEQVGGKFGGLDTPEYGAMNPNRKVPVIDDGGLILWESNAIVRYLAARYSEGALWPTDVAVRAQADRWMDWTATEWQPAMVPAFLGLIRTPEDQRDTAAIEASTAKANQLGQILEDALQQKEYIVGSHLTMADIVLGCVAHRWLSMPIERPKTPAMNAWYRRLMTRPATQGVLVLPLS